ncbi:hypothetical protein [Seonamhaeicola sp. ML3]|uniref:hypothetical protein n=1 Tax=Seonamhaeicola sp. ML3 TaxID=2937786 RepID=UPI00200C9F71|nr:hypothetical protein [Seonamhaeicola sp. ML3]
MTLTVLGGLIYYSSLKTRHKELIKSKIYYSLNLVDSEWKKELIKDKVVFTSPTFVISGIYKSMEGPKSDIYPTIDDSKEELLWLTSFKTRAFSDSETTEISNDFVCHTNFEYRDAEHYNRWGFTERINEHYPRITSISNGIESFQLPKGYGFPVYSNERIVLNAQALNHNITDSTFNIKHKIEIGFKRHANTKLKPLRSQTIYIMLPFDKKNPYAGPTDKIPDACIPVETKLHTYYDENNNPLSGHWIVPPGKHEYSFNASKQLAIKDSIRIHQITPHLHPFAETFSLLNKTTGEVIYNCDSENFVNKIGLKSAPTFQSEEGIWLYKNNTYELTLTVKNTTSKNQEMMASMAIFYYDKEMQEKIDEHIN